MTKMPTTPETFQDLEFPGRGMDLSQEISAQIPGTTPLGQNVRLYEPLTMRGRGGVRSGLSKYIPAFVNGVGPSKIQDIDSVVIVDSSGLGTGGGFQPVKNANRAKVPFWRNRGGGQALTRIQRKIAAYPLGVGPFSLAFDNPVVAGHIIMVAVCTFSVPTNVNTHNVTSSRNAFTQIAGYIRDETSFWYGIAGSSGADTISVQPVGADGAWDISIAIMEYGHNAALPLNAFNSNTATITSSPQSLTAGTVTVSQPNETIVSVFVTDDTLPGLTPDPGWNFVQKVDGNDAANVVLYIFDGDFSVSTPATCTYNGSGGGDYDAISASFKTP